ncbi:MAG: hypothetical protein MJ138_05415 [Kiritimatiellae bacterium]|nr:hypothetical protein [Kiritimatiellia bacterium]
MKKTCFAAACLAAAAAGAAAPVARVQRHHGEPAIVVDGKPIPPMTITVLARNNRSEAERKAYLKRLGEAGLKVFYVTCSTKWHAPGNPEKGEPDGVKKALRDIRFVIDQVPDAYVMLRLNVSPPADWVNAHPEEMVTFSDGKPRRVICTSVGKDVLDGMHSLCSDAWRAEGDKAIAEFFGELAKHPAEFDRVVGTFLCAAGTSEWYYPQPLDNADGTYGDFSEPFRKEYERFLRAKYGTEEELRRAWGRADATFEKPTIPAKDERKFAYTADWQILKALRDWETMGRTIGLTLNMDARDETSVGTFLNANKFAHVADFYTAWHEATARTIVHFAKTLKRLHPNLLTGAFYGSYGCQNFFDGGTASGTRMILDSGAVDFLAAPGTYNNREPGGIVAQREMQDSFRLRNLIYVCEDDTRTHRCQPWVQRDAMALYGLQDSVDTMKRDFARDLCEDVQGWWFDMGGDWYDEPELLALIKRQQEIAHEAYALDRTKKNEIALLYDTESVHLVSQLSSSHVLDYWRTTDLGRVGAPVDYYFHNDVANPAMPDYKLYVMVNQYCLSDRERAALYAKARRNGATLLWMYAPGFVDFGAPKTMALENVEKTVGMKLGFIDKTFFPHFRVDPKAHPALALASRWRRYGVIDRDLHSNIWIGNVDLPCYLNPGFFVDDPQATVLGRYCRDGRVAMALKETDGVKSVYCAAAVMRSDLLRSIAAWSGCHVFSDSDDVLYANENYVAVHANGDGKRTIRFKRKCSPWEVYERRFYAKDVTEITVDMRHGQTLTWQVSGRR